MPSSAKYEEAPLLSKGQGRSIAKLAGPRLRQDSDRIWRQPWSKSAWMWREAREENDVAWSYEGQNKTKSRQDCGPDVSDAIDAESLSTSAGQLSRSMPEPGQIGNSMPWQRQAKHLYPYLLPLAMIELIVLCGPSAYLGWHLARTWTIDTWRALLEGMPRVVLINVWLIGLASVIVNYAYHWYRLQGSMQVPSVPDADPLIHVVIVCSYKEPYDVLARTFNSLAGQKGLRQPPLVVFAAEARDPTWRNTFHALKTTFNHKLKGIISTEHVILEGEAAGKSANANFSVREVWRTLVDEQGLNPFEVMTTIVDADSVVSATYLAHVEASFRSQPDGRRLVYNGPLNVYRNLSEAGLLVQCLELARCHQDTFHSVFSVPYPFSNYSLTLGFASEIGFWTPDLMPEDIHTVNKAMLNSFGSRTTVTIPGFICNDLVPKIGDRYRQAKRHQWGSVTELAWLIAVFDKMQLRFPTWWPVFTSEMARAGSFISTVAALAAIIIETGFGVVLMIFWEHIPPMAKFILALWGSFLSWQWMWFWIAEFILWQRLVEHFPIERLSLSRWVTLVLVMPVLHTVNKAIFLITPTAHALYHAVFKGDLEYICAPKGVNASAK